MRSIVARPSTFLSAVLLSAGSGIVQVLLASCRSPVEAFSIDSVIKKRGRWSTIRHPHSDTGDVMFAPSHHSSSSSARSMNLFDSVSKFLQEREGDFVKLESDDIAFGPGPLVLLYNVPLGIQDDEFYDMLSDGAPQAMEEGVVLDHVGKDIMDLSVRDALERVMSDDYEPASRDDLIAHDGKGVPVLFFSGLSNKEMMATYRIMGEQIYQQWGGTLTPACAKAVPNAMDKPLGQVLEEISGDHVHAMSAEETEDTRM